MRPDAPLHWNAYPALLLALGVACGIIGAALTEAADIVPWVALGGLGSSLVLGSLIWEQGRLVSMAPLTRTAGLGLLVVGVGGAAHISSQQIPPNHALRIADSLDVLHAETTVTGRIHDAPQRDDAGLRFSLEAEHLIHAEDTVRVSGLIRIGIWRSAYADTAVAIPVVHEGDLVRVRGTLEPAPRPRNPADFDYGAYLKRRGIFAVLNTYESDALVVIGTRQSWLTAAVVEARTHIRTQIQRWVSAQKPRAVLQALLLGDRSRITDATRDRFARTGLMHLLAVSGLHVLLVGMVLYRLLRSLLLRLGFRWKATEIARAALTMSVLLLFMLITGSRPSVVRAVVMAGLFIGGAVLQRTPVSLNTLGVAALVLLLARPPALFDAGFQLSFSAVGAIVVFVPRLNEVWPDRWMRFPLAKEGTDLMAATVAATVGTTPVLLYHFGGVPLAGLVLNIVAIPATFLLMTAGLATVAVGAWIPAVAAAFGAAATLLADVLLSTASVGDRFLSWSYLHFPAPEPWVFGVIFCGVISAAQWPRPHLRWKWMIATLCVATVGLWTHIGTAGDPRVDVLFFDVGHGDAALVTLPNDRHLLIDAGPRSPYSDAGKRTILPHLRHAGVDRLDAVVASHADGDHIGGLPSVLRSVPVGRVLHNGRASDTDLFREVRHLADSLSIPYRAVQAGDTLHVAPSVRLQVLAPISGSRGHDDNNASVVLRLVYGETSFLFTGDVEAETESVLVQQFGDTMASDIVKVAHHGSSTSSIPSFIARATRLDSLTRAVVSVSRRGRFGLPDPLVLKRWEEATDSVFVTGASGAVWLRSDGKDVSLVDWQ